MRCSSSRHLIHAASDIRDENENTGLTPRSAPFYLNGLACGYDAHLHDRVGFGIRGHWPPPVAIASLEGGVSQPPHPHHKHDDADDW